MFSCPISARRLLWPATLVGAALLALACLARPWIWPAASHSAQRQTKAEGWAQEARGFFDNGGIPRLRIEIAPANLQALRTTPRVSVRATVREAVPGKADRVYPDIGIHLKGRLGSFRPVDGKPALTLSFDRFAREQRFHGLTKLCLNNSVQDPSYLCEDLGSWAFREAGVPTPRVGHARVWLNGRDLGLFVLKEAFSTGFLATCFSDPRGPIYEGNLVDIDRAQPDRGGKGKKDHAGLIDLVNAVRENDASLRRQRMAKVLDVDRFFSFMATETLIVHWDGYTGNRNNYRVYRDPGTSRFVFLAHGMDQLFQRPMYPMISEASLLGKAMIEDLQDRQRHLRAVAELNQRLLESGGMTRRLDRTSARILPVLAEIGPDAAHEHRTLAEQLRQRIANRSRNIERLLETVVQPLKFDQAGVAALSGWRPVLDVGKPSAEQVPDAGKPLLRIRAGEDRCTASWRMAVLLGKGRYVFQGRCRAIGVVSADGLNTGVGLRISTAPRKARLIGDSGWQSSQFEFEVVEPSGEVVLMCELRTSTGEAWFDLESLKLRRQ